MTAAQKARLVGFNASLKQRGVSVTIKPGDVSATCLVETVDEKTRQRLQIADDAVTHVVHVLRDQIVNVEDVSAIERGDSDKTYRVQHFKDDPQRPSVLFFCILS